MIGDHIHQALKQVRELQANILEKQRFKGYSGRARAVAGTGALVGTGIMSMSFYPGSINAHLVGWATILSFALCLNYGALVQWFLFDPQVKRDIRRLKPVIDGMPPLLVAGLFTVALIECGQFIYLFGMWLAMFGLANLASRHVLPKGIVWLGIFYIVCGAALLLAPDQSFLSPLPVGVVLFVGEWIGGVIIHYDGKVDSVMRQAVITEMVDGPVE